MAAFVDSTWRYYRDVEEYAYRLECDGSSAVDDDEKVVLLEYWLDTGARHGPAWTVTESFAEGWVERLEQVREDVREGTYAAPSWLHDPPITA